MMRTILTAVAIAVFTVAFAPVGVAATPEVNDLTGRFQSAGASLDRLQVYEIAGIVIIRGRAADEAQAAAIGRLAQSLGYSRVANLVQVVEHRDAELKRAAEVELAVNRSLDGCKFRVTADKGIVRVAGVVRHELQKDVAMQVLRSLDGARSVEVDLDRF